jgi:hypothetical protein
VNYRALSYPRRQVDHMPSSIHPCILAISRSHHELSSTKPMPDPGPCFRPPCLLRLLRYHGLPPPSGRRERPSTSRLIIRSATHRAQGSRPVDPSSSPARLNHPLLVASHRKLFSWPRGPAQGPSSASGSHVHLGCRLKAALLSPVVSSLSHMLLYAMSPMYSRA